MHFDNKLSTITHAYDAFIVDLWGVIHDGRSLYPQVIDTLTALKAAGKTILFLSNAPRRTHLIVDMLTSLGIKKEWYFNVMSSGEACYEAFAFKGNDPFISSLTPYYMYIGPERDSGLFDGLPFTPCTADKASFVLVTGFDTDDSPLTEKIPELKQALAYDLPMLCVNPDRIVVRQTGERALCAGILGETYEEMGGKVYYYGKPYRTVYDSCFRLLQGIDKHRIAAIGDSLETDIRGAVQAGIDSILITGGILAEELGIKPRETTDREKLETLCGLHEVMPTYVLPAFIY